jgi:bacterioferritin-associated ferredoxin
MIVCSCNVFTDRNVRDCLSGPAAPQRARDVYTALGCSPKCGCCAQTITALIQERTAADADRQAVLAVPDIEDAA